MRKRVNRVLVIGANGMLGYAVLNYFKLKGKKVNALTRKEFDIAEDSVKKLANSVKQSDVVVNCVGIIKPRIDKYSIKDVLKINGIFPWNLARLCQQLDTACFHITTDCVFSGERGGYKEDDYIDALDLYGLSKAAGDTPLCMSLRTSIIGEEKGQKRSLLEWAISQKGKQVNGFTNHKWNGVTTVYLAEIIDIILEKRLYKPGVFHIFSPLTVSKYELLNLVGEIYELGIKVKKTKAPQKIDRSLATVYPLCSKVVNKPLGQQVVEMREFFAKIK